jgi:dTDP-4-amino-4,6-dideoxygalactose transaminase
MNETNLEPIPFNRPSIEGDEIAMMRSAVEQGHTSAGGPFSALVEEILIEATGSSDALMTTSCTAALEMSAILLDLQPGDAVVVPSFGFVTTALAFVRQGARVLFCDIEPRTLALDPLHLAAIMDDTVRAVIPIHYAGIGCEIDAIVEVLAQWPRAVLIEDNAHGLFGLYKDRPLGGFGRFSALSFHETKNFICGEGGALILNDPADIDRAHVIYDKGTNRRAFMHGQVDKYSWQDMGSSFGLSDVLAAYLFGQLGQRQSILERRKAVFDRYEHSLGRDAQRFGYRLPLVPAHCVPAYHMFYVIMASPEQRNHVLGEMSSAGVHPTFHYVPLHSSPGGISVRARETDCPVTDDISSRLVRLPFFTSLSELQIDRVVATFIAALESFPR